jgi:rhamnosyltransferase
MRVLAHIHTFNDADIIDRTIDALLKQTRPIDGLLIVDNASRDDTLDQPLVKNAIVVRHPQNLGTSGTVVTGMTYALDHGYDWIWIFDADSIVEPDALEKLIDLYNSLPPQEQEQTAFLGCMARNLVGGQPWYGSVFTQRGIEIVSPPQQPRHFNCHAYIWSGCLYRLSAVRKIGLPNANYVLDCGEDEYGYRIMKAGYKAIIHQDAVLLHNIRGRASLTPHDVQVGPKTVRVYEFPPIRCYYMCRNTLYFVIYEVAKGRAGLFSGVLWRLRRRKRTGPARGVAWSVFLLTMNFVVRPRHHGKQIAACFRGIWHGFTGNIAARY